MSKFLEDATVFLDQFLSDLHDQNRFLRNDLARLDRCKPSTLKHKSMIVLTAMLAAKEKEIVSIRELIKDGEDL